MERIDVAVDAAKEAGNVVRDGYYLEDKELKTKANENDIVTEYDTKAQEIIINRIKTFFPEDEIIAEESGYATNKTATGWVIDPIDGTNPYARKMHTFGIVINYMENYQTVLTVVLNPVIHEMYVAQKGKGCFLNGKKLEASPRKRNQLWVAVEGFKLKQAQIRYELSKEYFQSLGTRSAAFSMLLTTKGSCDMFVADQDNIWDRAQYLMLTEAGLKVTDFSGKPFTLESTEIVAAHPEHHDEFLKNVQTIVQNLQ